MKDSGSPQKPFFIVDNMLRGLVRWLRFLGFRSEIATQYAAKHLSGENHTHCIFITVSSSHLKNFAGMNSYLLKSNRVADQLQELNETFDIFQKIDLFTLCSTCNVPIERLKKDEVKEQVPEKIYQSFRQFWTCRICGRVYWKGGHVERLLDKLQRMGIPIKS